LDGATKGEKVSDGAEFLVGIDEIPNVFERDARRLGFDHGPRHDFDLVVIFGDAEVVDDISEPVSIAEDLRGGADGEIEGTNGLPLRHSGLHDEFNPRLADVVIVGELDSVFDIKEHG